MNLICTFYRLCYVFSHVFLRFLISVYIISFMFSTSIKCDISASNEHIRTRSYVIYCNHYFRSPGVFAAQSEHIAIPPGTHDRKGTHKELMMIYDCIIIGAGASGLFCSASMDRPVRGLILEKTKHPAPSADERQRAVQYNARRLHQGFH